MMKKVMLMLALMMGVVLGMTAATPEGWSTDLAASKKIAAEKKRPMLLLFTGSDWCPYCIQLARNVLSEQRDRYYMVHACTLRVCFSDSSH